MNLFFFLIPLTILLSCSPQNISETNEKVYIVNDYVQDSIDTKPNNKASSINYEVTDNSAIVVLHLAHYQVPCFGEGDVEFCHLAQEGEQIGGETWEYFYDAILGFEDYEWGFSYELEVVKKEKTPPFPEDASSIEYHFVKLIEKSQVTVDTTFELPIKVDSSVPPYLNKEEESSEYIFLNKVKVSLGDEIVEADLENLMEESDDIIGVFQHDKETKGALILSSIQIKE